MTEKEKKQQKIEESRIRRKNFIAIQKAQNQMLDQTKEEIISKYSDDEETLNYKLNQIETMKKENIDFAKTNLGVSSIDEINSAEYREPNNVEIEKYQRHLESRHLTDEDVHNKKEFDLPKNKKTIANIGNSKKKKSNIDKDLEKKTMEIKKDKIEPILPMEDIDKKKINEITSIDDEKSINNSSIYDTNYEFDPSSIPDYIQYDNIPLPSNGECYPHKKSRIPVAYLTAYDENIFMSPNMYRDGKVIETIVKRKILDKSFIYEKMPKGDIDAIVLWLKANAYGTKVDIIATNPDSNISYDAQIDLLKLKYNDFKLKGDENGYFDYTTSRGDKLKFKFLSSSEINKINKISKENRNLVEKYEIMRYANYIKKYYSDNPELINDETKELVNSIDKMAEWFNTNINESINKDNMYSTIITENMIAYTMSINGKTDRDYICKYIENMRAGDAKDYRTYVYDNQPGIDTSVEIEIPESDGGGSFTTFLGIGDDIFIK